GQDRAHAFNVFHIGNRWLLFDPSDPSIVPHVTTPITSPGISAPRTYETTDLPGNPATGTSPERLLGPYFSTNIFKSDDLIKLDPQSPAELEAKAERRRQLAVANKDIELPSDRKRPTEYRVGPSEGFAD